MSLSVCVLDTLTVSLYVRSAELSHWLGCWSSLRGSEVRIWLVFSCSLVLSYLTRSLCLYASLSIIYLHHCLYVSLYKSVYTATTLHIHCTIMQNYFYVTVSVHANCSILAKWMRSCHKVFMNKGKCDDDDYLRGKSPPSRPFWLNAGVVWKSLWRGNPSG